MLFLATFATLLSLGATAPSTLSFPCRSESTTQVGHASFFEWIAQVPEQVLPQFKWYNKQSKSAIESGDFPMYSAPGLPKRSKIRIDSGDSVDEPVSPPGSIPKRSEASTESGGFIDEPVSPPGSIPKRSEASTESGAFIDEPVSPPGSIPKRSEASIESGESSEEPASSPGDLP